MRGSSLHHPYAPCRVCDSQYAIPYPPPQRTAANEAQRKALKGLVAAGEVVVHAIDCKAEELIALSVAKIKK